ncbi:hypothetical protein [Candidatus Borrarchaeum sp.]|uniref:hypothetical protein n=1 Tax=Candidatus Borrarchaeum sp. TaxID=2846742 RepID=UPI00257C26D4|nr:hypothetical protein [Candidatus Borrarchaeum sp.]
MGDYSQFFGWSFLLCLIQIELLPVYIWPLLASIVKIYSRKLNKTLISLETPLQLGGLTVPVNVV